MGYLTKNNTEILIRSTDKLARLILQNPAFLSDAEKQLRDIAIGNSYKQELK
jgi:hypothetical protein